MKNDKKCEICGKYNGKFLKSDIFGKVCLCKACIKEYWGEKRAVEHYELGDIVFVK